MEWQQEMFLADAYPSCHMIRVFYDALTDPFLHPQMWTPGLAFYQESFSVCVFPIFSWFFQLNHYIFTFY